MTLKAKDVFPKYKSLVAEATEFVLALDHKVTREPDFIHKRFMDDLGADSLDEVELIMKIEEDIAEGIPDDEAQKVVTVLDAILVAMKHDNVAQELIDEVRDAHTLPDKTVRRSLDQPRENKTDWHKVDLKTDLDIAADVASDPDAAPLLQEGESLGQIVKPHVKPETRYVFRNHDDLCPKGSNFILVPLIAIDQLIIDKLIELPRRDHSAPTTNPVYVRRPGIDWREIADRFEDQEEQQVLHNKKMSQETLDQIVDEATHAALTVLQSSGIYVNSMQTDALNDSITAIVRGDNDNRTED